MEEYIEELFRNYRKNKFKIKLIDVEIEEIKNSYEGCSGLDMSKEKTSVTHRFSSDVENEVLNKERRIKQLERKKIKLSSTIEKTENLLEFLEGKDKEVIELKYIHGLRWNALSENLGISEPTCRRIKVNAINELISLLN